MVIKLDTSVQDEFLSDAKTQGTPVVLYTINGFQIRGTIIDFDEVAILIESDMKRQMVYKHALSTVAPFQQSPGKEAQHGYKGW